MSRKCGKMATFIALMRGVFSAGLYLYFND